VPSWFKSSDAANRETSAPIRLVETATRAVSGGISLDAADEDSRTNWRLYRGGLITGGVYIGRGQEAVSTACGLFLQNGDVMAPLIRDQAARAAFGEPLLNVARTYLGSRQGSMRDAMATSTRLS
jgi:hypothetical protein